MTAMNDEQVRVLLIDDHPQIRNAFRRILDGAGYAVTCEDDVPAAQARLAADGGQFDVVLTDLSLPSGTGLDVLEAAHKFDPTLPVVFVTGTGDVEMAQRALQHGALRYLTKPVAANRLLAAMEEATRTRAVTHQAKSSHRMRSLEGDIARVQRASDFDAALDKLWMALQPVASMQRRRTVAYEALVRSDHKPLARPDLLIGAAEELGRLPELGRRIREVCAGMISTLAPEVDLLINLHPSDLADPELYDAEAPLTEHAKRIILEITERASLDEMGDVQERISKLRLLGYRIAVDDLGAGYGSLNAIALIRPDLVKLDMSLVRNVHQDPVRTRMVRSIGAMCQQLGTPWLCEGVETIDELRVLIGCGADLVQGYLLGRPQRDIVPASSELFDQVPRLPRATRPSQRIAMGSMAQGLCREALAVLSTRCSNVRCDMTDELRTILGALRDLLDNMADDGIAPQDYPIPGIAARAS
jgi:EAL domain-containing protein (putative c-di-GMP-specific phosphodiesterase class I)